jgi:hypothetical protein
MPDELLPKQTTNHIGLMKESSLHAGLKDWYSQPADAIEQNVKGYYIDIVRGEELIEIQTQNFSAINHKVNNLLRSNPVHLVYPLTVRKWIKKVTPEGVITIRKSPKKGRMEDIFWEVVKITKLIVIPGFTLEVIWVDIEESWIFQPTENRRRSWRRKGWMVQDRQLLNVSNQVFFNQPGDYAIFLDKIPNNLDFSSNDLANQLGIRISLARKMVYTFKNIGIIQPVGKKRNSVLYSRTLPKEVETGQVT